MNVKITNLGIIGVPFSTSQDKGFITMIEPGGSHSVDVPTITVANVGDNPSATEEFKEGMRDLLKKFSEMIAFWREKNEKEGTEEPHPVRVHIENRGPNDLRVLLGSNLVEAHISAGATYEANAPEYVEIRELGV